MRVNPNSTRAWEVGKLPGSGKSITTGVCSVLTSLSWGVNSPLPVFGACYRTLWFRESGQNGVATLLHWERARDRPDWGPPPQLYVARDQKLIRTLTGAAPLCRPQPGGTSPALGWSVIAAKPVGSGDDARVAPWQNFWQKTSKWTSKRCFLTSHQKFKKI